MSRIYLIILYFYVHVFCTGTPKEKLLWAFNLYDINGDGRITRDELIDIICSVYSLSADRERTDGADGDDRHSKYNEAQLSHADRVFQVL